MDFNGMLLSSLLLYGRYDTKTVHRDERRVYMNYFLAFLQLACSLKMLVIMLIPWDVLDDERPILFYLIEFYVINSGVQKAFYVAISGVHFHIFILYLFWGHLCSDPARMQPLNFLFMPNIGRLCRQYDLTLRSTSKFVRRARIYKRIMYVICAGAMSIFYALTIRCLYESYWRLPFAHFLFIACPSAALTLFGYLWLPYSFLSTYLLALITMEFLVLRASNLSERIRQKFRRPVHFCIERDTVILHKKRKQMMKILHTLGDIVKQFKATNHIFDHLVSLTFVSCLVGALIYPIFVFLDIPGRCRFGFCFSASIILFSSFAENLKAMMIILYLIALGNNCFVISVFNDSFVSKARPFTLFDQVRANPE